MTRTGPGSVEAAPARSARAQIERLALGPTAAVRSYLVLRSTLLLLSIDVWMTHLGPAWRYGAAGFNVPHFSILGVLPTPTTASHVGMLALVSGLALVAVVSARPPRAILAAIAVLYTWGWSSSMLDSYQHHYLLSWMLLAFVAFPPYDASALFGAPRPGAALATLPRGIVPCTHAPGVKLVWILAAVVYAYTAINKTEPDWLTGDALRNITHDGRTMPGVVAFFSDLGWAGDDLWRLLGRSTIAIQIVCALGYASALVRDALPAGTRASRGVAVLSWLALGAAVSFHVGAEHLGLEIGWFSYYMIALALVTFLPASWLGHVALALTWPSRAAAAGPAAALHPLVLGTLALGAAGALAFAASEASLPGVPVGAGLVVLVSAALVAAPALRARGPSDAPAARAASPAAAALSASLGWLAAAAVMHGALAIGLERFDYWRFAGGDLRRRGETAAALDAYRHALRFAPASDAEADDEGAGAAREPPRVRMERRVRELEARLAAEGGE